MSNNSRNLLLELAQEAIAAVRGDRLVRAAAEQVPDWPALDVLAVGKAASSMLEGACEMLGPRLRRALLIIPDDHPPRPLRDDTRIEIRPGDHPLPGEASIVAGRRLLEWLPASADPLLVLLSGGASALVEVPAAGISLEVLQRANRWLLGSGLDISRINAIRKRLSRIKGGQLLRYVGERPIQVWMISDVRGDDPAVIGSGLLYPPDSADLNEVDLSGLPEPLRVALNTAPAPAEPLGTVPEHRLLANLRTACDALAEAAFQRGLRVQIHDTELCGDAAETGVRLVAELVDAEPGLHVWGGETTVRLPPQPGRGGRNQHLALAVAMVLAGKTGTCLLTLGTDGSDGPTDDAGALVDGGSIERGELAGLDAGAALRAADAGTFLEASGDLVSTGPTGTNVRDIVLAWKTP